jgi:hypothetical protein
MKEPYLISFGPEDGPVSGKCDRCCRPADDLVIFQGSVVRGTYGRDHIGCYVKSLLEEASGKRQPVGAAGSELRQVIEEVEDR